MLVHEKMQKVLCFVANQQFPIYFQSLIYVNSAFYTCSLNQNILLYFCLQSIIQILVFASDVWFTWSVVSYYSCSLKLAISGASVLINGLDKGYNTYSVTYSPELYCVSYCWFMILHVNVNKTVAIEDLVSFHYYLCSTHFHFICSISISIQTEWFDLSD